MGKTFRNGKAIANATVTPAPKGWQPDADMQWAKSVCENDVQSDFSYKILQMINDGYVYTDIVVPSGGAVKTSDGEYYTANAKHTWDDANARQSAVGDYKVRWLIYYTNTENIGKGIQLLDDCMYACFDGVKFGLIFENKRLLGYFDIINGADLQSSVTDIKKMFYYCYSLQTIPLLNTSSVTSMRSMFTACYSLHIIPLLNTSSVTDMYQMFYNCYSLRTIPLLNTSSVTSMGDMFYNCTQLQSIPLLDTSSVTSMSGMFYACSSLQSIPLLNTSSVTSMSSMFYNCSFLQTVTLNLSAIPNASSQNYLFNSCSKLEFLTLTNIKWALSISNSTKYSHDTLLSIINNIVDLTEQTSQKLTMGSTNLNKLSAEEKAIATNKNWTLA